MVSSMDRWSILSFCQRLIHYSARFPGGEIQHIFLFNHVCQLWFYQGYVSHSFTQVFSVPVHKWNHLSIAKTAACTCLRWTKFLGNYPDQWVVVSGFALQISFFLQSLAFFCISCQSLMVTFNHLQTGLCASHSFIPSLLLCFFMSNLSEWHTLLTMLPIQHWQINWFQWFKSAINVSFPT